jgi:hypothetical protein
MSRRPLTLSQLLSWSVPFLLVLLLIPAAPSIVRIISGSHTGHLAPSASKTTTTLATTTTTVARVVVRHVNVDPTTTTTVENSKSGTSSSATNSTRGTDTVFAPSGELSPPFTSENQPLGAGTTWTLTATGEINWSLSCNATLIAANQSEIVVPVGAANCVVTISTTANYEIAWQLHPVD